MRLLLKRRYNSRGTPGRLFIGKSQFCFIREAPKSCFNSDCHCLEEGVYELEIDHTEENGWRIRVGEKGWILSKSPEMKPASGELCPVTSYSPAGTPLFTRLAFLKLMDELVPIWERGEVIELQVVSMGVPYAMESCRVQSFS